MIFSFSLRLKKKKKERNPTAVKFISQSSRQNKGEDWEWRSAHCGPQAESHLPAADMCHVRAVKASLTLPQSS